MVATNSRSKASPDSLDFSVRRWRRNPSRISIPRGPMAVSSGLGRSRRETRKLCCLPLTATPANPSMTLRFGCQPSPMSKIKSPPGTGWPVYQSRSIHAGSELMTWSKVVGSWWPMKSSCLLSMGRVRSCLFGAAGHFDEHRLGARGDFVFRLTGEIGVDDGLRLRRDLGSQAGAVGGEPIDELAETGVA